MSLDWSDLLCQKVKKVLKKKGGGRRKKKKHNTVWEILSSHTQPTLCLQKFFESPAIFFLPSFVILFSSLCSTRDNSHGSHLSWEGFVHFRILVYQGALQSQLPGGLKIIMIFQLSVFLLGATFPCDFAHLRDELSITVWKSSQTLVKMIL